MGDRGNIAIKQAPGQWLWIYAHWHGSEMASLAQNGIRLGKPRSNDLAYFNRCVITEATKGAMVGDPTGFGVGLERQDNQWNIVLIEPEARAVRIISRDGFFEKWDPDGPDPREVARYTFDEYLALTDSELERLRSL